jgi:hypothetical protein
MMNVGGNNHPAAGDFVAHEFGRQLFAAGNVRHLLGEHTLAGIMHLREIPIAILGLATGDPLRPRSRPAVSIAARSRAVTGSHAEPPSLDVLVFLCLSIIRWNPDEYSALPSGVRLSAGQNLFGCAFSELSVGWDKFLMPWFSFLPAKILSPDLYPVDTSVRNSTMTTRALLPALISYHG